MRAAVSVPIATGENIYGKYAVLDLLQKRGVDILQPDARRAGGVMEIMEMAALADAYNVRIATHSGWQHNAQLLAAMTNSIYLEASGTRTTSAGLNRSASSMGWSRSPTAQASASNTATTGWPNAAWTEAERRFASGYPATTGLLSTPMPSISTSIVSPGWSDPPPEGVPV